MKTVLYLRHPRIGVGYCLMWFDGNTNTLHRRAELDDYIEIALELRWLFTGVIAIGAVLGSL